MGMTIDKAISWLLSITECEGEDIPIYDTDVEALKMAIETMRRYQKIENLWADFNNGEYDYAPLLRALREVLEDGNGVSEVRI